MLGTDVFDLISYIKYIYFYLFIYRFVFALSIKIIMWFVNLFYDIGSNKEREQEKENSKTTERCCLISIYENAKSSKIERLRCL